MMQVNFPDKGKSIPYFFLFLLFTARPVAGQISLDNGWHNLEISGMISSFYNQRFEYAGNPENRIDDNPALGYDRGKDRFGLRDMQLQIEGRVGRIWEYEFQVDFADLANQSDIGENPGVMDAYVKWNGPVEVTSGYTKIPYSRNSLVPFAFSPFWQRAEISRGEVFSRRDVGVIVSKSLWKKRINLYTGCFTGMGEQILGLSDNDPSGTVELVARADAAWPSRFRYRDFDIQSSPLPMVQAGIGVRTVKRKYSSFLPGDDYYLRVMSGRKSGITADISGQWKGFSFQAEWHLMRFRPENDIDPSGLRYREDRGTRTAKIGNKPTDYFLAGGLITTISYCPKKWRSVFSIRYDQLNPNDLISGNSEESLNFAYAYLINGFNTAIKAQYSYRLADRKNPLIQRFDDQLRVGFQFLFR